MYIHRYESAEFFAIRADVYPFIDDEKDAVFSDRIGVLADGRVIWHKQEWTPEQVTWYAGCVLAAFTEAFKIAREQQKPTE